MKTSTEKRFNSTHMIGDVQHVIRESENFIAAQSYLLRCDGHVLQFVSNVYDIKQTSKEILAAQLQALYNGEDK